MDSPVPENVGTPGSKTNVSISKSSHTDYTCYTVRSSTDRVLALIIETKMKSKRSQVIAQVGERL